MHTCSKNMIKLKKDKGNLGITKITHLRKAAMVGLCWKIRENYSQIPILGKHIENKYFNEAAYIWTIELVLKNRQGSINQKCLKLGVDALNKGSDRQ